MCVGSAAKETPSSKARPSDGSCPTANPNADRPSPGERIAQRLVRRAVRHSTAAPNLETPHLADAAGPDVDRRAPSRSAPFGCRCCAPPAVPRYPAQAGARGAVVRPLSANRHGLLYRIGHDRVTAILVVGVVGVATVISVAPQAANVDAPTVGAVDGVTSGPVGGPVGGPSGTDRRRASSPARLASSRSRPAPSAPTSRSRRSSARCTRPPTPWWHRSSRSADRSSRTGHCSSRCRSTRPSRTARTCCASTRSSRARRWRVSARSTRSRRRPSTGRASSRRSSCGRARSSRSRRSTAWW